MNIFLKLLEIYEKGMISIGNVLMLTGLLFSEVRRVSTHTWKIVNEQPEKYAYILTPFQEGVLLLLEAGSRFKEVWRHLKEVDTKYPEDFKEIAGIKDQFKIVGQQMEECMAPYVEVLESLSSLRPELPEFVLKSNEFIDFTTGNRRNASADSFAESMMLKAHAESASPDKQEVLHCLQKFLPGIYSSLNSMGYAVLDAESQPRGLIYWGSQDELYPIVSEKIHALLSVQAD